MAVLLTLLLLSTIVTYSNAEVCVCKDGNEQELQKVIDYACASGADCTQIQQTGSCFKPDSIKNHCDVAVNSYYQKKASTGATCDFNGAAVISTSPPSNTSSCLSSSGTTGTTTNGTSSTTGNSTTGNPYTGNSTIYGMPNSSSSSYPTLGPSGAPTGFGGDTSRGKELSVRTKTVMLLTTIVAVVLRV
ncbi:unnamed protein product [Cochlearia groenlandica]